ncbi:MAG TPA: SDR family oxidoreductase [Ramlibacter sp.]|nr:SDR family oxidoreductase [Ramlibacter sp.]
MSARFEGQRALVLGGGSGIGLACARMLARGGAQVTIAGRTLARLEAARAGSPEPLALAQLDGSRAAEVEAFFEREAPFHHLVLCANAGGTIGPFGGLDVQAMREYFDNKLWVYLHALKYGGRRLVPGGSVTLVNGAASQLAVAGMGALAVVNGGLDAILRPLALEYAPSRINAVSPGVVDTPYWAKMPEDRRRQMYEAAARGVPVGRVGTADDIADAVVFLAGNGFITGTVLLVDGGRHLTPNVG